MGLIKRITFILLIFLLAFVSKSESAITVGNTANSGDDIDAGTTTTVSLNNNQASVIVGICIRDTATSGVVSSVTYNGDALTQASTRISDDSDGRCYVYFILAADAGTNNVVVTYDSAINVSNVYAIAVDGLSGTQPDSADDDAFQFEESVHPDSGTTPVVDNTLIVGAFYSKRNGGASADSGQSNMQIEANSSGDSSGLGWKLITGGAGVYQDMDWTMVGGYDDGWSASASFAPLISSSRRAVLVQ